MRILIAIAALALSACAGMTPQQLAGTASSGLYAAATIAQAGTVDERLAPTVTRAEMIVMRTRLRLQNGVIGPDAAAGVLARTDAAVADIQAARAATTAAQREQHIAAAQAALDDANSYAETAR